MPVQGHILYLAVSYSSGKVFPKMKRKGSRMAQSVTQISEDRSASPSMTGSMASVDEGGGGGGGGSLPQGGQGIGEEEEEATDYVFRIIAAFRPESLSKFGAGFISMFRVFFSLIFH